MADAKHREVFIGQQLLLPELGMIGHTAHKVSQRALRAHTHANSYEICLITRGAVEWWVGDELYDLNPGDLYITRPGEAHGAVDAMMHPSELYWAQVNMNNRRVPRGVASAFNRLKVRTFPGSAKLQNCFEDLLKEHRAGDEFSVAGARADLQMLLVTVLRDHDIYTHDRARHGQAISSTIREAMEWIKRHLEMDVAIDAAAQHAGLSISQFHQRFRREVGFPPAFWRTQQRVRLAKQLLRGSKLSVLDIAMRTGFSTSQYFATVFKKMTGLTPGQYRRQT